MLDKKGGKVLRGNPPEKHSKYFKIAKKSCQQQHEQCLKKEGIKEPKK
jgi:hypothetical protein